MAKDTLKEGLTFLKELTVVYEQTAKAKGSGGEEVFSTPDLVLFLEEVCFTLINEHLNEDESSVGTVVNIKHIAATPIGMKVTAKCKITLIDRRRLVFDVCAYDEVEKIAEGVHERFIINKEKFMDKVKSKLN